MTIPLRPTAAAARNPGIGTMRILQVALQHSTAKASLSSIIAPPAGVLIREVSASRSSERCFATNSPLGSKRALASARPLPVDYHGDAPAVKWTPRRTRDAPVPQATMTLSPASTAMPTMAKGVAAAASEAATAYEASEAAAVDPTSVKGRFPGPAQAHPDDGFAQPHPDGAVLESPQTLTYVEGATMPITSRLHLVAPEEDAPRGIWPVFRLMDDNGTFRDPRAADVQSNASPVDSEAADPLPPPGDLDGLRAHLKRHHPHLSEEIDRNGLLRAAKVEYADVQSTNTLYRAFRQMIRLKKMDHILLNAQRQGRISFYMTCRGEEAIHMGAASALDLQDPILAQYREQGLLMWRGFTLEQFTNQCFSNNADLGKGRQMPVHYGSRALNYHTVSSPLGTQLPQAVGVAYRLKLAGKPNVAACFFGDGCASTTDFHAALNFAATLQAPVLFVCRNNGYAISTPTSDQYRGDGIISRAKGYGMAGIRVDGNDVFAVHAAVREAKRYALEHSAPVLIEAMTYRQGHHSTSDDSTRYRSASEVSEVTSRFDPISRLAHFLRHVDWLTLDEETAMRDQEKVAVLRAMEQAERRPPPPLDSLFEDVYKDIPRHLQEQKEQLREHLAKYPKEYNL